MDNKIKSTNGILILENETPEDVAKAMIESGQQKEPFYVFDIDEAYRRVEHFKKMLPRVQIFYAMKSNDNERMVKLAATLGLGFDCASPGEINKILKLNLSPLSIIFAVASKPPYWMTYARSSGVRHTTFDSSCELKKIKQYWPDARLLIRIKVDGDSIYMLGDKFGCDFETEAIDLLEEAAALNLKVVGVAFHVGSGCFSIESHMIGLRRTRTLFDHEAKAGREMNIVNIGGGFLSDSTDSIDQVSKLINSTLEELFPDPTIQVIAEPGRYLCDSSSSMYCSVNNVRKVTKGDETINMIYLNDGTFGSLKYNEPWHTVKLFERRAEIKGDVAVKSILWGPSCHAHDRIMNNVDVFLPQCTPFDWLIFPRRGAYALAFASSFSSIQTPLVRSVISQELWKKLKDSEQFISEEFVRTDISSPLPSTLPPITNSTSSNRPNYTLKV